MVLGPLKCDFGQGSGMKQARYEYFRNVNKRFWNTKLLQPRSCMTTFYPIYMNKDMA
jgi:hypothetical protein